MSTKTKKKRQLRAQSRLALAHRKHLELERRKAVAATRASCWTGNVKSQCILPKLPNRKKQQLYVCRASRSRGPKETALVTRGVSSRRKEGRYHLAPAENG